jgi:hypothetical protein
MEWGKAFASHASDKELISTVHITTPAIQWQQKNPKTNHLIKKLAKEGQLPVVCT